MPYTAHVAWVAQGRLPGGEVWSCTLRTEPAGAPPFDGLDLAEGCETAKLDWQTFLGAGPQGFATGTYLDRVLGYVYDEGGILVEQAASSSAPFQGTGTQVQPNQCAVVVSLLTGQAGRSRRGRIYVPWLSSGLTAGRLVAAQVTAAADRAAVLAVQARDWGFGGPTLSGELVVASATYGYNTPVTQIRIGNVMDTQQRRRDDLVEEYQSRVLPSA